MTPQKSICFVHSPEVYYEQSYGARFVPLWAYTLASYVPENWGIAVHDCTFQDREAIPRSDIFAFSAINQDFCSIRSTHEFLKKKYPDSTFILGGPIAWSFERDGRLKDLEFFDHLFVLDGEETLPAFLKAFEVGRTEGMGKVIHTERFPFDRAQRLRFDLLSRNAREYYGGVVEISRGCPFLCEFCDIRVLPNNNEAHNKDVRLIVEELDNYHKLGVRQIQMACDNFIGDLVWANRCVDAILEWEGRTKAQVALYTWTTVNISKLPDLMVKMRRAGFTTLFIGVESFNSNSILETAKVQNRNDQNQMVKALEVIQSYGFIIAPGLIFGFDSDTPSLFQDTLNGVVESGLISGDPTFLLALPGTPLYSRMKRTGRLVEYDASPDTIPLYKERVSKVESNIRYLQPKDFLVRGFMKFVAEFTSPRIMYARFRRHVQIITEGARLVPVHSIGYGSLSEYLKFQFSSLGNLKKLIQRILCLGRPGNLLVILKAYALVLRHWGRYPALKNHFTFWLFIWSNLLIKYAGLKEEDFRIHSVEEGYDLERLWKELDYEDTSLRNGRNEDQVKVAEQLRSTKQALARLKGNLGTAYRLQDFIPPS